MQVQVIQEALRRGLAEVGKSVAGKTTLPVLSNVLLATDGDRLKLYATDLSTGVEVWLGAQIQTPGAITVPFKLFNDYVAGIDKAAILSLRVDSQTQTLYLTSGRLKAEFKGIEADEMPVPPAAAANATAIPLDETALGEIKRVLFAAADDDTRPVLQAVNLELNGAIRAAAADGFRLAVRTIPVASPLPALALNVPASAFGQLVGLISDGLPVTLLTSPDMGQLVALIGDVQQPTARFVCRLIDGKYPDILRVVPKAHTSRAIVKKRELVEALRRAALFARSSANIVKFSFVADPLTGPTVVQLQANAAEVGAGGEEVDASVAGEPITMAVNASFFLSALASIATDEVALECQTPQNPVVLKPVGQTDGEYLVVLMPMTVR